MLRPLSLALAVTAVGLAPAQTRHQYPQSLWVPVHSALGHSFATWQDFVTSALFQRGGLRCGTLTREEAELLMGPGGDAPSDCSTSSTNPAAGYSPANNDVVVIDVVFHVLQSTTGQGNVSNTLIQSQIDILNEDYRALAGTPGAPGVDTKVQFRLAQTDPAGNPTTGITRTTNNNFFNDTGSYWTSLAWDTSRYINIYTNQAGGNLGYSTLPFPPLLGTSQERVVLLWSAVGRNAPIGAPYNQGRTATHELGHYLGLFHTFEGGCGTASCLTSGDLICDTNAEANARFGCPVGATSCGTVDPIRNYMDYTDDACMNHFTEQQARRIRCVLDNRRPNLAQPVAPTLGANYCTPVPNSTGLPSTLVGTGTKLVANNDFALVGTQLPLNTNGYFICSPNQASIPNAGGATGTLCVGAPTGRYISQLANSGFFGQIPLLVDLNAVPQPNGNVVVLPGETWNFQLWYRDAVLGFATSNFSDGYTITFE